ncbi:hypothetical protein BaRGS_00035397 [Batillaria attramentaria]|uniref:PiggyBac transposable element-derived protein 4 C-terminal zinc-finger domain-containing protein n=1 Tax=Batillaria attramentaria TaxID=370345 RepID=A0ABD0JE67_9CAEN
MDGDTASKFVASLVKSIQALCNGYIDFSSSIEVIGHIHLRIDENKKFNYVLSEEVSKSQNEAATVFSSHSYHSQPPQTTTTGRTAPSDSPSRNRRKTQQVPRVDESTLPPDVPSASKDSRYSDRLDSPASRRLSDGGDSRDTDTFPSVRKHEHNSGAGKQSTPSQDSFDRRRKLQPDSDTHSSRSQDPVPKKSRTGLSLSGSAAVQSSGFEVIEIKEEPADDESGDFFGDNNAAGQDISQPDFSNLVADSLDRVGQLEGTSLLAGGDAQQIPRQQLRGQQDQPFPIMLHANPTASTSSTVSYPGPSDQQGAVASSSGGSAGAALVAQLEPIEFGGDEPGDYQVSQFWHQQHRLERIPPTERKANSQKKCRVCRKRGIRSDSRFQCPVCPGQPGLCRSKDCFEVYHQSFGMIDPLVERDHMNSSL